MRLSTMQRMSVIDRALPVRDPETGELSLHVTDESLDAVIELVRTLEERRFRIEGMVGLQAVMHLGTDSQREKARAVLDELAQDSDELLAVTARQLRDRPLDESAFP